MEVEQIRSGKAAAAQCQAVGAVGESFESRYN